MIWFGGVEMENLKSEVFSGFGIKPKSITKSKHCYICRTNFGTKVIQKTTASEKALLLACKIKQELENSGYPIYDKYYISDQGTPFFVFDNEKYIMTDFKELTEADFSAGLDVIDVIKATALFHKISKNIVVENAHNTNILNIYKKQLAKFKNIKKNISSKGSFSEFDVIFIKNYDYFFENALNSLYTLNDVLEKFYAENENLSICHGLIKEETAVRYKNKMSLISFENVSKGLFICDFADIINRYIRKHASVALNFETIIETYSEIYPISSCEIEILQAMLKFPAKYIKTCCDFYSKGIPFVPNSVVNHLKCIISQKKMTENYTKCL